ncbi:MAG: VWA domain-containing protein [Deltaproteobacteria bacterium]|nr:VWA domain-containing protein [Deltaproteobacteria bacterium]
MSLSLARSARTKRAFIGLFAAFSLAHCATLQVDILRSGSQRPSQVAAYFTLERLATRTGVGGLPVERFSVLEDGNAISPNESRATLLDPMTVAAHHTIVLVDASGTVSRAGFLPAVAQGVRTFLERIGERQHVSVYAFDGESTLRLVGVQGAPAQVAASLGDLATLAPRDSSTNLHGAVILGMQQLDRDLANAPQPLKFGTLVVLTASRDIAHRMTASSMSDAVTASSHTIYAAGVGPDTDVQTLRSVGRTDHFYNADPEQVSAVLTPIADRISGRAARHYFLSYCSPSRADRHRVRIEAREESGAFGGAEFELDATGFRTGCDAARVPDWVPAVATPAAPTPAPSATPAAPPSADAVP